MSFMTITCPWCGTTYTTGMVGRQMVGSGHRCGSRKQCQTPKCRRQGTFMVGTKEARAFSCPDHIAGRVVVMCRG